MKLVELISLLAEDESLAKYRFEKDLFDETSFWIYSDWRPVRKVTLVDGLLTEWWLSLGLKPERRVNSVEEAYQKLKTSL